mgnify:CR=1 FL=1|tara:strand:+ start:504 stop:860 length:357 start_codon:yes stop_codon:yes gene_type:complete
MLNGILADARTYNPKNHITGALICREDIFLQLLEGPKDGVLLTYKKILNDDRHLNINLLVEECCQKRIFPDWYMKDDPARSWFWNKAQVDSGILQTISSSEVTRIFSRIALELLSEQS